MLENENSDSHNQSARLIGLWNNWLIGQPKLEMFGECMIFSVENNMNALQ
jgi:hypothetical protein